MATTRTTQTPMDKKEQFSALPDHLKQYRRSTISTLLKDFFKFNKQDLLPFIEEVLKKAEKREKFPYSLVERWISTQAFFKHYKNAEENTLKLLAIAYNNFSAQINSLIFHHVNLRLILGITQSLKILDITLDILLDKTNKSHHYITLHFETLREALKKETNQTIQQQLFSIYIPKIVKAFKLNKLSTLKVLQMVKDFLALKLSNAAEAVKFLSDVFGEDIKTFADLTNAIKTQAARRHDFLLRNASQIPTADLNPGKDIEEDLNASLKEATALKNLLFQIEKTQVISSSELSKTSHSLIPCMTDPEVETKTMSKGKMGQIGEKFNNSPITTTLFNETSALAETLRTHLTQSPQLSKKDLANYNQWEQNAEDFLSSVSLDESKTDPAPSGRHSSRFFQHNAPHPANTMPSASDPRKSWVPLYATNPNPFHSQRGYEGDLRPLEHSQLLTPVIKR